MRTKQVGECAKAVQDLKQVEKRREKGLHVYVRTRVRTSIGMHFGQFFSECTKFSSKMHEGRKSGH